MVEASLWSWAPLYERYRRQRSAPRRAPTRDAEGVGCFQEHHIRGCEGVAPLEPGDPPYQTAVLDHDALRFSGRAGRWVEDVGEVVRFWRLMVRKHPCPVN